MTQPQEKEKISQYEHIKFAKPEDITQIVALGFKDFKEVGAEVFGIEPSVERGLVSVTDMVVNDVVLVLRNEDDDRLIDGVIAFQHMEPWWSEETLLRQCLLYIKPNKRSYNNAKALLEASKEYAIMSGLNIVIDLIGTKEIARKEKLLKRHGFEEFGSLFIFKPNKES